MSHFSSGRLLLLVLGLATLPAAVLPAAEPKEKRPTLTDWKVFRGNASRSAQGVGGAPFLDPSWRLTTLPSVPGQTNTKDWIKAAIQDALAYLEKDRQQPVLPALFPIASEGKLVYRAHDAVWVVNLKTEKVEWYQEMRGSLHQMVNDHGMRQLLDQQWKGMYLQSGPQGVYFENSLIGTLSTDGDLVFAIDDVVLPPPAVWLEQWGGKPQYPQAFAEFFSTHNQLIAVELDSG